MQKSKSKCIFDQHDSKVIKLKNDQNVHGQI